MSIQAIHTSDKIRLLFGTQALRTIENQLSKFDDCSLPSLAAIIVSLLLIVTVILLVVLLTVTIQVRF